MRREWRFPVVSLIALVGLPWPVFAQACKNDTRAFDIESRKKAVFQIAPASDPNTVAGTATLIHPDGLFVTAAHTVIDYDPANLVLQQPGNPNGFRTAFRLLTVVYPSGDTCPTPPTPAHRCKYRTAEKAILAQLGNRKEAWSPELDFALLVASQKMPADIKPVPIRAAGYSEQHVQLWGYPGESKLGPTNKLELRPVTAAFAGDREGLPLYDMNFWSPGLSGSLALDGRGRGFGIVRRWNADPATIKIATGMDLEKAKNASLMFVLPFDEFVKAGLLNDYGSLRLQGFIDRILKPTTDGLTGNVLQIASVDEVEKLTTAMKEVEWTVFDLLGLKAIDKALASIKGNTERAFAQRAALYTLAGVVTGQTCDSDEINVALKQSAAFLEDSLGQGAPFEGTFVARSAAYQLASVFEWGSVEGGDKEIAERFAKASVAATMRHFENDADRSRTIATWGVEADEKVGGWSIWTETDHPIYLAAKADGAPYVLDRFAHRSLLQGKAATAAAAYLSAKTKLNDVQPDFSFSSEFDKFVAVTDSNYKYSVDKFLKASNLNDASKRKFTSGTAGLGDFTDLVDPDVLSILQREG